MDRTDRRLPRRLLQLHLGLLLYGLSLALVVEAGLGTAPWDVLHQGLARSTGLSIGTWVVLMSGLVLLLWVPLRLRPGVGTVANALLVGTSLDVFLGLLPDLDGLGVRALALAAGVGLNAVATAAYIGARLGAGPRDGLMTGIAARGHSVRAVRTGIELTVLAAGVALGGTVGVGTVVYALGIGPLVQPLLPALTVAERPARRPLGGPAAA
ncbi:MAG TPA: hypothetical protein VNU66_08590 [Mycobacteriales bacterium]|nr:hypothetical protein [Mycobacteriales bacterium]